MEPDSSVLDVRRRIAAFVVVGAAVGTWFVLAPHIGDVGLWPTVVIVSAGVLPATLLLVLIALPLSRLRWNVLLLAALALGLVALGCSEAGWALAENFAKLWGAIFAGWAFLYLFEEVWLVVLIAAIIPIVDAVSVFTPGAPTHEIVKHHISIYNHVAVAFLGPGGAAVQLGPPDILFYALFLAAAARFRLRTGWTWLATTGLYAASFPIAVRPMRTGFRRSRSCRQASSPQTPTCSGRPSESAPSLSIVVLANLHDFFHWSTHGGYNFVSGPLADITLATAFLGWLALFWRKHNCHVHRCWRLSWHPHPDHGHPVCKKHHPESKTVTA